MNVVFEFLGSESIENVITAMHFKVDKVAFFGYEGAIQAKENETRRFLSDICGVSEVSFHVLSQYDLQDVLSVMRKMIMQEKEHGAEVYFDITGGESLILVAFGMLSSEFGAPIHMFDVVQDKLIELNEGAAGTISLDVERRDIRLDLDKAIMLRGATINYDMQKNSKVGSGVEFENDVTNIWEVAKANHRVWNSFSEFLARTFVPDDQMRVSCSANSVISGLQNTKGRLKKVGRLNKILDELGRRGILRNVVHEDGRYSFSYKDENVYDCLKEAGCILELRTYLTEANGSFDARVGVHIDWDGIISGRDVLNEIDVLMIDGNIMTFISCKGGKLANNVPHALYELDTVARRFGGKYAKKILIVMEDIGDMYKERAREMDIEVKNYAI